ncbi:MAG: CHASE2 domain-containing protein [Bacillota bacterium]
MKIKSIYITLAILLVFGSLLFIDQYSINNDTLREGNIFVFYENYFKDLLFQDKEQPDTRIKMITIDDASLDALGQWPWPRGTHAELLNIISEGNPAVIAFDIIFSEPSSYPDQDAALVQAVKKAGNVIMPTYGQFDQISGEQKSSKDFEGGELLPDIFIAPFPELYEVCDTGHINVFKDVSDGVVRQHLTRLKYQYEDKIMEEPSFAIAIYNQYVRSMNKQPLDMSKLPVDNIYRTYIDFTTRPSDYEPIPYHMVLNREFPAEYFKDTIVLIGPYSVGLGDSYYTSMEKQAPMYGVEIHANIIESLLKSNFKANVPFVVNLAVLFILGSAAYFAFKRFIPAISVLIVAGTLTLYVMLVNFVYEKGYMMSVLYPVLSTALIYLIMLAYRYIEELMERKRITGIFGRYVAPQVVKEILDKGEDALQLGGTRREISALFVDIRGFTPMSEKAQPEEVVQILNEYLDLCEKSIFRHGGTLDKFIGDATMAIFNAPLDLEDHAFKAVCTAWAMKQGSIPLQEKLQEKYGRSVQFGIGVNTGYAVVGNIGSKSRMDYTAIGDTVNTAARLESNAKPGQILISEATYELTKDKITATALGGIKVKGKEQEIIIYQLDGIK